MIIQDKLYPRLPGIRHGYTYRQQTLRTPVTQCTRTTLAVSEQVNTPIGVRQCITRPVRPSFCVWPCCKKTKLSLSCDQICWCMVLHKECVLKFLTLFLFTICIKSHWGRYLSLRARIRFGFIHGLRFLDANGSVFSYLLSYSRQQFEERIQRRTLQRHHHTDPITSQHFLRGGQAEHALRAVSYSSVPVLGPLELATSSCSCLPMSLTERRQSHRGETLFADPKGSQTSERDHTLCSPFKGF